MKGYLTFATFNRLCRTLDLKENPNQDEFLKNVYDNTHVYNILNKIEIKELFNFKNLLENEKKFEEEYYQYVPPREDSKSHVFDHGGKSKYHLSLDCKLIKKDYQDFCIPPEITDLGDDQVEEYRRWFIKNGFRERYDYEGIDILPTFIYRYNMKFPQKYGVKPLGSKYKLIEEISNSDFEGVDIEFNYGEFQFQLNNLVELHVTNYSGRISRRLSKMDYLVNKPYTDIEKMTNEFIGVGFLDTYGLENLNEFWLKSRRIKGDLMNLLFNYFKWTYKLNEKSFDEISLEKFGLACCRLCKTNSVKIENENSEDVENYDLPF